MIEFSLIANTLRVLLWAKTKQGYKVCLFLLFDSVIKKN